MASPIPSDVPSVAAGSGFRLDFPGLSLAVSIEPIALVILLLGIAILAVAVARTSGDRAVEVTVEIPLGGLGRLTFNADREVARLAHQAWIEIQTRKAGLPLDEENDVIEEVFNSWYELFKQLRAISKDVPPSSLRTRSTRLLIRTLVDALNLGLRPVLTKWQARYRAWLAAELRQLDGAAEDPQTTQRRYPFYDEMIVDLRRVNGELRGFADALDRIAQRGTKAADT